MINSIKSGDFGICFGCLESSGDLFLPGDADPFCAIALRQFYKIRRVGRILVPVCAAGESAGFQVGHTVAFAVEQFLPLAHHSQVFIVEDADDDLVSSRTAVANSERSFLHAAVAGDGDNRLFGIPQFGSDGSGETVAHSAQAAGHDQLFSFCNLGILRYQHLVLSHICDQDGFLKLTIDFIDNIEGAICPRERMVRGCSSSNGGSEEASLRYCRVQRNRPFG